MFVSNGNVFAFLAFEFWCLNEVRKESESFRALHYPDQWFLLIRLMPYAKQIDKENEIKMGIQSFIAH